MNEYRIDRKGVNTYYIQNRNISRGESTWTSIATYSSLDPTEKAFLQMRSEEARIKALNEGTATATADPAYVAKLEGEVKKLTAELESMRKLYE